MCEDDELSYEDASIIAALLTDILSSGQGEGFDDWHANGCKELLDKCSDTTKKEVFELLYSSDNGCIDMVTIEEIKWFMCECGVNEFKLTLTVQ